MAMYTCMLLFFFFAHVALHGGGDFWAWCTWLAPLFFFLHTHMMPLVMVWCHVCLVFCFLRALCGCAGPPLSGAHLLLVLLLVRAALLVGVGGRGEHQPRPIGLARLAPQSGGALAALAARGCAVVAELFGAGVGAAAA